MRKSGFTLTELLAVLAILGIIATFTIPKILHSSSESQWNASAKEMISAVSQAYLAYRGEFGTDASIQPGDLTPYLNYVELITSAHSIDHVPGGGKMDCKASQYCLKMHNGGILLYNTGNFFGNATANNFIFFVYDPDAEYSGTTNGVGKSLFIMVFYDGRVADGSQLDGSTIETCYESPSCSTYSSFAVPDWYSW